jgi:hypothetical protein
MNRHDLKSMSAELPWSVDDFVAFNRVQAATHMVEFWAQEQRLKHLNEYCDKAVAEIRASLDRTQGNQAPLDVASRSLANTDRVVIGPS